MTHSDTFAASRRKVSRVFCEAERGTRLRAAGLRFEMASHSFATCFREPLRLLTIAHEKANRSRCFCLLFRCADALTSGQLDPKLYAPNNGEIKVFTVVH